MHAKSCKTVMKLITVTEDEQININYETVSQLKLISAPIVPVSVIGPILSGKSTFLNQVVGRNIFLVKHTTNPTTTGIWVYPQFLRGNKHQQICMLFMDCQGLDHLASNQQIELKIMIIVSEISKMIVHVGRGAIESNLIARVASLGDFLPPRKNFSFPDIALIQKDFSLKLIDGNDQLISADEYLQNCLRSFKDKQIMCNLRKLYHGESPDQSEQLQHLSLHLLPPPTQTSRYNQKIGIISKLIKGAFANSAQSFTAIQFCYRLNCAVEELNKQNLSDFCTLDFEQKVSNRIQEDSRVQLSAYKAYVSQECQSAICPELPLQEELVKFKISQIVDCYCEETQRGYVESLINWHAMPNRNGQLTNVQEVISKHTTKMLEANVRRLETTMDAKISQLLKLQRVGSLDQNLGSLQAAIDAIIQKLHRQIFESCTALNRNSKQHDELISKLLYKKMGEKILAEASCSRWELLETTRNSLRGLQSELGAARDQIEAKQALIHQKDQELQLTVQQKQSQITELHRTIEHLQTKHLQTELSSQELLEQLNHFKINHKQIKEKLEQYHKQVQSADHCRWDVKSILTGIQHQQVPPSELLHQKRRGESLYIESMLDKQAKIRSLEETNRMLRNRIQECGRSNAAQLIEEQYRDLSDRMEILQKEYQHKLEQKQQALNAIQKKLELQQDTEARLWDEIQVLRAALKDHGKGTEFMQTLVRDKDNTIQSLRKQVMQQIETHNKQKYDLERQKDNRILQLEGHVADLTVQIARCRASETNSAEKYAAAERREKDRSCKMLEERDQEISRLRLEYGKLETSLSGASQAYGEVTCKLEELLRNRESENGELNNRIEQMKVEILKLENKGEENLQRIYELKAEKEAIETEREQKAAELNSKISLLQNKLKHYQNIIEKLKADSQDKSNTFVVMLKQLRADNMLKSTASYSRDARVRSVEQIEDKILRELRNLDHCQTSNLPSSAAQECERTCNATNTNKGSEFMIYDTHKKQSQKDSKSQSNSKKQNISSEKMLAELRSHWKGGSDGNWIGSQQRIHRSSQQPLSGHAAQPEYLNRMPGFRTISKS